MNDQCIKSMSAMIQSRDSQTEEQSSTTSITFDSLPRRLIGVCASFLEQWSFRSLSKVNRAVYLGCNMPIVLTQLVKRYNTPDGDQLFNLSAFPFVEKLTLRVAIDWGDEGVPVLSDERMHVFAGQIAKMSRLQSLKLGDYVNGEISTESIGIVANHEELNRRTKYLYVEQHPDVHANRTRFLSAISSFKHLQFLKVRLAETHGRASRDNLNIKPIIDMCSNLKGLDFYDDGTGIQMAILQAIGHQLHCLTFYDLEQVAVSALKDVNFANLQQLRQGGRHDYGLCPDDSFCFILKTAVNLEKVGIDLRFKWRSNLITEILSQCERLKYLEIECDDRTMKDALDVILCYFEHKDSAFKQTLKIRFRSHLKDEHAQIMSKFERIVNSLSASKVDQWMIILHLFKDRRRLETWWPDELQRKLIWNRDVARSFAVDKALVITNPDCTINGVGESWLM